MVLYIYSVINEDTNRSFGRIGLQNQEVVAMPCKDIALTASIIEDIDFGSLKKEELTEYVTLHQKVNEALLREYDVVPMAFGLIAQNQDEVLRILEKAYLQFKMALQKIAGKVEFAVQIFWEEKKFLEELVNNNPEIKKLKEEAQSLVKGIPAKLKLGKLIFETIENKRKEYIKDVENSLKECSLEFQPGKLLDETMIGNISFLIEKKAENEFDKKMQELGERYGEKLRFKYVGPMPPYSFVNINLSLGNFELVNEARKLLGLGEEASLEEVQKAYRKLSHQYHPDKVQGKEEEMKKIIQARAVLANYCQSCAEFLGKVEDQKYSFKKEDVENSLIIKGGVR